METIRRKTKLEIIEETAAYYGADRKRRSVVPNGDGGESCRYFGPNGERCATSRCFDEAITPEDVTEKAAILRNILDIGDERLFAPAYRGHDSVFWEGVMDFHDEGDNWGEDGLTALGAYEAEKLKSKYADK
jgi:hypothetical protein